MNRQIEKNKATIIHVSFCCKAFVPTGKALAVPFKVDNKGYSPFRLDTTTRLLSKNRITTDMSSLPLSEDHTSTSMNIYIIFSPIEIG